MSVRWRLVLLMLFATGVPVLTGVVVTRQLVRETLDVGLNPQLDAALEAGVRQARQGYREQRADVDGLITTLAAGWPDTEALALLEPSDRLIWRRPGHDPLVLQAGALPPPSDDQPAHAAPAVVTATAVVAGPGELELSRPVPVGWREDATLLAGQLQMIRGLQVQQAALERMYALSFLAIFLLALAVGLALAWWLSNGITEPVRRLVDGTDAVADGRWDVQVPVAGGGELAQLTGRFNTMVRTLELQSRRLVDLEKMEGWREMARALAHEVKNPLTPIQLTVEEIRARCPDTDPQYAALVEDCTRIVVEEVESLRTVVARFREFSRPVALSPEPVDLASLVRDIATLQRDLRVEVAVPDDLEPLPADPDRLRQVLMNLATNAREATREVAEPRLAMTLSAHEATVAISVEDNGPGVPADQRERIFEPYRSGKAGGLGLGLALVKGIVLAHDGDIAVDAGRWGGARFTITLPRPVAAARPELDHA
jgi:nitrogen fixation/metabolism regulation signal transduction histidine kinase